MFKRGFLKAMLLITLILCLIPFTVEASDIQVIINGDMKSFNPAPVVRDGSTLVPMRGFFEALGCEVKWDNETQTAIGIRDNKEIKLPIGGKTGYVNGNPRPLATEAQLINGSTYIPLRFVGEALGDTVLWDNGTIKITSNSKVSTGNTNIAVHFIDVGQADSIFIDAGEYDILIDAGNNDDGDLVVDYLKKLNTDDIEIIVATHNHEDHIGGLDDVLQAFEVEKIIDSGQNHTSKTYEEYVTAVLAEQAQFIEDNDMTFEIAPGAVFKIIETGDDYEDLNNTSVVSLLDVGEIEFLFTGDMEEDAERDNLNKFFDVDILKVGHHGSNTSSSKEFLDVIKPEVAVISVGKDNSYGHPHNETLERLASIGAKIYRTDKSGTIVIETDGSSYSVNRLAYDYSPVSENYSFPSAENEGIIIQSIDLDAEVVVIKNTSSQAVDMSGWKLVSVKGNQTYTFPAGFTVQPGATVRVVSGQGAIGDGVTTLKWTGSYIWNNDGDPGILYNAQGVKVSEK